MREIKFRAWHRISQKMSTNTLTIGEIYDKDPMVEPKDITWLEYTGLKDKNGTEIYEGDVVRWRGNLDNDACCEKFGEDVDGWPDDIDEWIYEEETDVVDLSEFRYWLKDENFGWEGEDLVDPSQCEVIGNIYENPEILSPTNPTER